MYYTKTFTAAADLTGLFYPSSAGIRLSQPSGPGPFPAPAGRVTLNFTAPTTNVPASSFTLQGSGDGTNWQDLPSGASAFATNFAQGSLVANAAAQNGVTVVANAPTWVRVKAANTVASGGCTLSIGVE